MLKNANKAIFILIILFLVIIFSYYNNEDEFGSSSFSDLDNKNLEVLAEESAAEEEQKKIVIHLSGAVKEAGVYQINAEDRLVDLIKAAGGLSREADLNRVNLAESLIDGEKIIIPKILKESPNNIISAEQFNTTDTNFNNYYQNSDSNLININRASQTELETLSGIGPGKASAIIKYRENNGSFTKKENLTEVSGIGEKTLEKIIDEISLR